MKKVPHCFLITSWQSRFTELTGGRSKWQKNVGSIKMLSHSLASSPGRKGPGAGTAAWVPYSICRRGQRSISDFFCHIVPIVWVVVVCLHTAQMQARSGVFSRTPSISSNTVNIQAAKDRWCCEVMSPHLGHIMTFQVFLWPCTSDQFYSWCLGWQLDCFHVELILQITSYWRSLDCKPLWVFQSQAQIH